MKSSIGLREALDFKLSNLLRYDLLIGVLGGAGAAWLSVAHPSEFGGVIGVALGVVGIVLGAVIAGVAILTAFLDQPFLRKLRAIGREPIRYVRPFLFTAVLGVAGILTLLVLLGLQFVGPTWLVAVVAYLAGLLVFWTLASVIPNLGMLVQFVGLQFDASEVPDNFDAASDDNPSRPDHTLRR